MNTINNGGPAFPTVNSQGGFMGAGMSLRAWLTGMALQGILSNKETVPIMSSLFDQGEEPDQEIARLSLKFADAVLANLEWKEEA
jgi:hypothetical protein